VEPDGGDRDLTRLETSNVDQLVGGAVCRLDTPAVACPVVPEGHTIHRLAIDHSKLLVGRSVRVSSPQGRFAADAARIDAAVLDGIEAYGKHLFHWWSTGDVTHVHLGLFGRFRLHLNHGEAPPPPRGEVRMRLQTEDVTIDLSGPTDCRVDGPDMHSTIVARLGPDPLRSDAQPHVAISRMQRSTRGMGALLLDQSVIAGLGNVYRAEVMFVHGIHPLRPGRACDTEELAGVWSTTTRMLRAGVKANRIVTVRREELGLPRNARIPRRDAFYVYQRDRCIRCGDAIQTMPVGNRTCYFCPTDQPR
jgi:endonuclease-8